MRNSHRLLFAATAAALSVVSANMALAARNPDAVVGDRPATFSGSYLAARSADLSRDLPAALDYYNEALTTDPQNPALVERILLLSLANGNLDQAFALGPRLLTLDESNPAARVSQTVETIKQHRLDDAQKDLDAINQGELSLLTSGLLGAWIDYSQGKVDEAVARIDKLKGPDWYTIFKQYHTALILDAAGRQQPAVDAISAAYKADATALRIVEGYARILARAGKSDEAVRALTQFTAEAPLQPVIRDLLAEIKSGRPIEPAETTVEGGAAEALYGLGSAIGLDDGPELPAAYLRLSAYLDPTNYLTSIAIGDAFQGVQRCDEAIPIYDSVPKTTSLRRNADLQIGNCLVTLDKPDEAATYIKRVVDADPTDVEAATELGNVYRANNRFSEAADAYTRGIAAISDQSHADWRIFYYRGVSLERAKRWPEAEADFNRALAINPEQAQVLNYLGYSWVDRGINLDKALTMIQKAVDLRPNDGYIVDSLGWAFHKMGRNADAVSTLEAAVLLKPEDPTINDHLGDAYWTIGRKREATFQWAHARDLQPEKEDLPKILAKIEKGLSG